MFNNDKIICPLLNKPCIEGKCKFWTHILGKHPQTGNPVDHFDCAVTWLPVLLIETSQEVRQGAAATESFRNEVVTRQGILINNQETNLIENDNGNRRK